MRPHDAHGCRISGDTIRSVRRHWLFSQTEFAEQFGATLGTVYIWERDGVTCRSNKFDRPLFRVLKLSRDVLEDTE